VALDKVMGDKVVHRRPERRRADGADVKPDRRPRDVRARSSI